MIPRGFQSRPCQDNPFAAFGLQDEVDIDHIGMRDRRLRYVQPVLPLVRLNNPDLLLGHDGFLSAR